MPGDARPRWMTALAALCAAAFVVNVVRDLFVPASRAVEVWFGLEVHGLLALLTAPIHWAIFALAAWGFWTVQPWIVPATAGYLFYAFLGAPGTRYEAVAFYVLAYGVMNILAFASLPPSADDATRDRLDGLKGLAHRKPWHAAMIAIAMPASPQNSSSLTRHSDSPAGSLFALARKSKL